MLTLPRFELATPTSLEEAVVALGVPGARVLAGGTDLLPNLKNRISTPTRLVSLRRVPGLALLEERSDSIRIGAMCTLAEVAASKIIGEWVPSLARAAGLVSSPQLRAVGTLGGNINLDTRCRYINQSLFWREALGGCLKAETCAASNVCHVVPKGTRCVAALSSDTVPVLVSQDAEIHLHGESGHRSMPIAEYFQSDGTQHTVRGPAELLTHVVIPKPVGRRRSSYVKWSVRKSIDYPMVSIALRFDGDDSIVGACAVLGVLGSTPRVVDLERFVGRRFDDVTLSAALADFVFSRAKPLANIAYDAEYRRRLVRVLTRRAVDALC